MFTFCLPEAINNLKQLNLIVLMSYRDWLNLLKRPPVISHTNFIKLLIK